MGALTVPALLALMQQCVPGHAPSTLLAVAATESPRLDPLWVGDNTTRVSQRFPTADAATQAASALIAAGHSVDLGQMQINSVNLPWLEMTVAQAFNPCRSLKAAVKVLLARYQGGETPQQRQLALRRAISAYNTGSPTRGFANGYVLRVQANAALLIPALDVAAEPANIASEDVAKPVPPPRPNAIGLQDALHPSVAPLPPEVGLVDGLHPSKRN